MQDCYVNFFLFSVIAWFLRFSLSNTDDSVSGWISGRKKWTSGETQNKILTTFTGLSINMTHAHRYGNSYFELLMFSYLSIRQSSFCIMYNTTVNWSCYLKEQHVKSLPGIKWNNVAKNSTLSDVKFIYTSPSILNRPFVWWHRAERNRDKSFNTKIILFLLNN